MAHEEGFFFKPSLHIIVVILVIVCHASGGGGDSHMKGAGMLVGHFELNLQRRPIWAWSNR